MPLKVRAMFALVLLFGLFFSLLPAFASAPPMMIYLQRGIFDPLHSAPSITASLPINSGSQLALVQLDTPPDEQTRTRLLAAGLRPLAYIPDNTFIVRVAATQKRAITELVDARWSGPFAAAYKLPAELDQLLTGTNVISVELRL